MTTPRYQRVRRHPFRTIDTEGVVVRVDSAEVLAVNATGTFLLEQLTEPRTLDELVTALVDAFDVDRATARHDVSDFLEEMQAAQTVDALETPGA